MTLSKSVTKYTKQLGQGYSSQISFIKIKETRKTRASGNSKSVSYNLHCQTKIEKGILIDCLIVECD